MKQKTMYTESQPDVRYSRVNESRADVIVNKYIGEEEMIIDPETGVKQIMYAYMTNIFSVDPNMVTEADVKSNPDFYLNYEEEKEKDLSEKVAVLEEANMELTATIDNILTEVIPSIMGV